MSIIWLSILFTAAKSTFARNIANRRLGSDLTSTSEIPELYTNKNILRDLTLSTEAVWEFEEVHYDEAVGLLNTEHYDCYGINIACTLAQDHIRPICGLQAYDNGYEERFMSMCEMDYRNCLRRVELGFGVYGNGELDNDYLEFENDGNTCVRLDLDRPAGK